MLHMHSQVGWKEVLTHFSHGTNPISDLSHSCPPADFTASPPAPGFLGCVLEVVMQNWASLLACYHCEIHAFEKRGRWHKGIGCCGLVFLGGGDTRFSLGKRKLVEREECKREGRQREVSCVIVLSYKWLVLRVSSKISLPGLCKGRLAAPLSAQGIFCKWPVVQGLDWAVWVPSQLCSSWTREDL